MAPHIQQSTKLLAIKDEYEVARLYTDGRFEAPLRSQFAGWERLSFHMAPPLLARPGADGRIRKLEFGGWMWTAMKWLARARALRGTALDPFGRSAERRLERQLIADYEALLDELLAGIDAERLDLAVRLARLPESIRGLGHVKLASVATAKAQWADLLDRYRRRAIAAAPQPVAVLPRVQSVAEL